MSFARGPFREKLKKPWFCSELLQKKVLNKIDFVQNFLLKKKRKSLNKIDFVQNFVFKKDKKSEYSY